VNLAWKSSCPEASWLSDYYLAVKRKNGGKGVAANVGCNNGYDSAEIIHIGVKNEASMSPNGDKP